MGVAHEHRTAVAFRHQFDRELYQRDHSRHNPDAVPARPTPRPPDWGSKAYQRALTLARQIFAGDNTLTAEWVGGYLWADRGIAKSTALRAATEARTERAP